MTDQVKILAKHLNVSKEDAETNLDDFLVYSDDDAQLACLEFIVENIDSFKAEFIANHSCLSAEAIKVLQENGSFREDILESIEYIEDLVQDAIDTDGRGHFLASYDGLEHEVTVDGETFYVYRTA